MRHIIQPLFRHRLMPLVVVLQVALACAIACNALFLLQQKLASILTPDGIGDPTHLVVATHLASRDKPWPPSRLYAVELALHTLPGVTSVSVSGSLPMETLTSMMADAVAMKSGIQGSAAIYIGDHLVTTLGLRLIAGRDFTETEQGKQYRGVGMGQDGPVIITAALAARLFPDGHALGKMIRIGHDANDGERIVVGVVEHLVRNQLGQDHRADIDYSMLFPGIPGRWPLPTFAVRAVRDADMSGLRYAVETILQQELGRDMVTGVEPRVEMYSDLRERTLARPRAAVWLLAGVSLVVLVVTLAGIMGLTGYWVQQRTRQIGILRALGAKRSHILHHIQWENLLVVGLGVLLGLFAAYAVNLWLMHHYELSRLPWTYLPIGAVLMLVLGQVAVLAPALRAAAVPPVVATRSV